MSTRPSPPERTEPRLPRLPPRWAAAVPVALILFIAFAGLLTHPSGVRYRSLVVVLSIVIAGTALYLRERAPVAVLGAVLVAAAASNYAPITTLAALFAVFTVARNGRQPATSLAIAAAATAGVLIGTPALHGHALENAPPIISRLVAIGLAVALGLYLRARRDYIGGLQERAERLEREQELLAARAVADERVRIARELHDVVAHNVSLMVVQSQALVAIGADPQQRAGLDRIAAIGREAMSEMHRMLGVLRVEDVTRPAREPQPGVRDLPALVERTRDTGLDVTLITEGEPRELPPGVDLSVFRIAQEALTNVIRHARAHAATVTVDYAPHALRLTVTDDGSAAGAPPLNGDGPATGHGLVGMRERVALFGGTLDAGPKATGRGYRVHATLPLN